MFNYWHYQSAFLFLVNAKRFMVLTDKKMINDWNIRWKGKFKMRWMVVFFVLLVFSSAVFAEPVCTHIDMEWISQQVPLSKEAKIVYKKDQGELCEVVLALNGSLVSLYAGKDFLLVGNLFKDKKSITRETLDALADIARKERIKADKKEELKTEKRKAFFQQNIRELDDLALFSFKPGNPDKILYVVTDPNCPYCNMLIPDLEILAIENQIEIKVILFPVLGSKSRDMATQAICGKYSYQEYRQIQFQPDTPGCSQAGILLEKIMSFFSRAALSFVPVVISGDGTWVVEENDISQVKQNLGIVCDDGASDSSKGCAPVPEN
jgi:hypothetical protein